MRTREDRDKGSRKHIQESVDVEVTPDSKLENKRN
jgi:hypothetical protein